VPGVQLGLGLISIGRGWGHRPVPLPSDAEAEAFLQTAHCAGIRYFDTAPSYGSSERRLGAFLHQLPPAVRDGLTIATKCGEHWDESSGAPYVDHSYDALARSIERSLALLPAVHLLQVHKSTAAVIRDGGVRRALEYARRCGVRELGVSATDVETAALALADPLFSTVQIFYNAGNRKLEEVFDLAARAGKRVLVNRPFGMGALLYDGNGRHLGEPAMVDAFRYVLARSFDGVVLTGTRSPEHLGANIAAFERARSTSRE
jgi:aryl-alcohol dehydrogenase-like predicted oxidoreductase